MIECKPYNMTLMAPTTCIKNQERLAEILEDREKKKANPPKYQQSNPILQAPPTDYFRLKKCHGCETGLALYHKHLKGETMPDIKTCSGCQKPLPATLENFDPANRSADGLTNACKVCRGTAEATDKENLSVASERGSQPVPLESKTCELDGCGKEFTRRPEDTDTGWMNRKYCYDSDCSKKAERKRDAERKKNRRKALIFDKAKADAAAREAADETMAMFSAFISDHMTHDQIKAVAIQAGIKCYRKAISGV